ncbi:MULTISPECIES: transposase [Paraburkholderia]|nr:transposase [Paraburkholderia podalyriae]
MGSSARRRFTRQLRGNQVIRAVIERFVEHSPMTLMARLVLQCALDAEWAGDSFEQVEASDSLQMRESLFSMTVETMSIIAARLQHSVDTAAKTLPELPASITALHDRISRTRSGWGRTLVRDSAQRLLPLVQPLLHDRQATVSDYRLRILDGSRLPASERCSPGPSGCMHGAMMPGGERDTESPAQSLVVYDPDLAMIVDLVPWEHGRAQERPVMGALLDSVQPGELWIVDRHFNTRAILAGWPRRGSAFIVQEHGCSPVWLERDCRLEKGRIESGLVYEQSVSMTDELGSSLVFRRIELHLDHPDMDGDTVIRILTNVPASHLSAHEVVRLSCRHWSETLPVPLEPVFYSGVLSSGTPRAALLAFGVAALAYNGLSAMVRAVSNRQELNERETRRLPLYIAAGVRETYAGMMIAVPSKFWQHYDHLVPSQFGRILKNIAAHVDPRSRRKQQREHTTEPKTKAMLRASTLDSMFCREAGVDPDGGSRSGQRATAMATRDFSSNPSKALRDAAESPVMVTKYGQAIAFLVSVEDWNRMKSEIRETTMDRLAPEYPGFQAAAYESASKPRSTRPASSNR